ncbi:hypothetical protein ACFWN5_08070 [Streptomyces sp. NPDC058430]|uniref:hypothetical protein n=1 Tax=Streptomyces sp. NPDC058430 TaxID=3346495 RepID=UPI00364A01C3
MGFTEKTRPEPRVGHERTAAEWAGPAASRSRSCSPAPSLGPLFAVSRSICQDGVRTPHFGCILVAVAQ